ncbi:MAG: putative baseplate assembly protein [Candidatus Methanoperedens sp.]|nr:putative baseplate assembly protein [Candidatus Methanoperedens sp.]
MALPKQNLDDKTFEQLVDEARKLIPRYTSLWTDHNLSDPGITFVDLFAWLTEMTLFRINLIKDSHRLKYLKLLGFTPEPAAPAKVDLTFEPEYLFCWDKIPGSDNSRLKEFLKKNSGKGWITTAEVEKIDGGRTIRVFTEQNSLLLRLNDEKTRVNLRMDDGNFDKFIVKIENGRLEVYESIEGLTLKKGTGVYTEISGKSINFELCDDIWIAPVFLEKVIIYEKTGGVFDRTGANNQADLFYAPFGLKVQTDNTLYLGFNKKAEKLSFMCYLYEKDLDIPPGRHGEETDYTFRNAEFDWEISVSSDEGTVWRGIDPETIVDETEGFNKSGRVIFNNLQGWVASTNSLWKDKENKPYFWLRCILRNSSFQYPPRIETIRVNTVSAIHGRTFKNDNMWLRNGSNASNGLPHQVFKSANKPILDRTIVLSASGEHEDYLFSWDEIPGTGDVRLVQYLKNNFYINWVEYAEIQKTGDGNTIKIFTDKNRVLIRLNSRKNRASLKIDREKVYEFAVKTENGKLNIYSGLWTQVDDFDGSGPDDNHFILDKERGEIMFGDGLNGKIPPASSNIRVIRYRAGGGREGNTNAGYEWKIGGDKKIRDSQLRIVNKRASTGGKGAETMEEAIERCLKDLKVPFTAVTSDDFEYIAKNTPGLRVAKAKAIPNYQKDEGNGESYKGSVTVAVLPYTLLESFDSPPVPSPGFINAVCRHLDKHRLLGTDIHIESPQFVRVDVSITIDPVKGYPETELIGAVKKNLNQFLHPVRGWFDGGGWPIGRIVSRSEVFELINKVEGVNCILKLTLSGNNGASYDNDGNLKLPGEISTVYPGSMTVIINKEVNKCRKGDNYGRV